MPLYQLTMQTNSQSVTETLQFIAGDVASAIMFANRYTSDLPAELWSDGKRICQLEYDQGIESWIVIEPAERKSRGSGA